MGALLEPSHPFKEGKPDSGVLGGQPEQVPIGSSLGFESVVREAADEFKIQGNFQSEEDELTTRSNRFSSGV